MKEKLLELQKQNISVYCCRDTDRFLYGKLLAVNDDEFALLMYTPSGMYDGVIVKRVEDIIRIEYDGQYEQKMQKVLSQNINFKDIIIDDSQIAHSVLGLSLKQNKIVSVELLNSGINDVVGFVDKIHDNKCTLKLVDEYGYKDGYCCILISDITQVMFNGDKESLLLKLWEINQGLV